MKRIISTKRQRGQGMTEYIIMVALIAIAAFGAFNLFGHTVREVIGTAASGLAGQSTTQGQQNIVSAAQKSQAAGDKKKSMDNFGEDNQQN